MRTGEVRNINLSLLIEFEPFPRSPIAVWLFLGGYGWDLIELHH